MDAKIANILNDVNYRIKHPKKKKSFLKSIQFNFDKSDNFDSFLQLSSINKFLYNFNDYKKLYVYDIYTKNNKILQINFSGSFIIKSDNEDLIYGKLQIKMKLNDSIVALSESIINNIGYHNITLNHILNVDKNSLYTVSIDYETKILSDIIIENPSINSNKNGISISILLN